MNTRYNVGDIVKVEFLVEEINVTKDGVLFLCAKYDIKTRKRYGIVVPESELDSRDYVPVEVYEEEVNKLKDEINRLRMIIANAP